MIRILSKEYIIVNGKQLIMKVNMVNLMSHSILLKIDIVINVSKMYRCKKIIF